MFLKDCTMTSPFSLDNTQNIKTEDEQKMHLGVLSPLILLTTVKLGASIGLLLRMRKLRHTEVK